MNEGIGAGFKPCEFCKRAIPIVRDPVLLRDKTPRLCGPCDADAEIEWREMLAQDLKEAGSK